jgi:4'-phosphopantetheinyl transferase
VTDAFATGALDGEVHVWQATLDRGREAVEELHGLLSSDERARAARFRFARDRDRYVVGRGLLRRLLAGYLGIEPVAVAFRYGAHDKPELDGRAPAFNVSHSGPVGLFAFVNVGEIGVDVELDREQPDHEQIAERFFSPAEREALRALPAALRSYGFLSCWTRKEAFVKARGDGLSLALDSFDVSLEPAAPPALLRTAWSRDEPRRWRLVDLSDPGRGYVASLAVHSDAGPLVSREAP